MIAIFDRRTDTCTRAIGARLPESEITVFRRIARERGISPSELARESFRRTLREYGKAGDVPAA